MAWGTYKYTATGGETEVVIPELAGMDILLVIRQFDALIPDTDPGGNDPSVLWAWVSETGTLTINTALAAGEIVQLLWKE